MKTVDLCNVLVAMSGYARDRASDHHNYRGERTEASLMYSISFMLEAGAQRALQIATEEANREPSPPIIVTMSEGFKVERNAIIDECYQALFASPKIDASGIDDVKVVLEGLKAK